MLTREQKLTGIELNILDQHMDGMIYGPRYAVLDKLLKAYKAQNIAIERLSQTLEWYGDKNNHEIYRHEDGDYAKTVMDRGEKARAALLSIQGEE